MNRRNRREGLLSRLVLPPWVFDHLSHDSHTLIQQAELIAAVGAYWTMGALLEDEAKTSKAKALENMTDIKADVKTLEAKVLENTTDIEAE